MTDGLSTNPGAPKMATGFINLGRGAKWKTRMGWKPAGDRKEPKLTTDYSAVVASLDLHEVPAEMKKGQQIVVQLDCDINPVQYWVLVAPTSELHELFQVSGATHYPPGGAATPELTLVAKQALKRDEIPEAAAYIMLLS